MIFAKSKTPNKHRAGKIPIFFFDSECALCDKLVMYLFKHTKKGELRFCTIHSMFADHIVRTHLGVRPDFRTSYLLKNGSLYQRTDAILKALELTKGNSIKGKTLKRLIQIVGVFNEYVLFNRLFDRAYDIVSKYRERLMHRNLICELPSAKYIEEGHERFIS
jgi:predicted DCC family thiol-disulfide oxidoreductase YuxK